MTIATLMATCAMFLVAHWTAGPYAVLALTIGGVVCIAAAIAGATSQDLKTGYLVGATPYWQQVSLLIGVAVSSFAIGGTLILMNVGLAQYKPIHIPARHHAISLRASSAKRTTILTMARPTRSSMLSARAKFPTENTCTIHPPRKSKFSGCRVLAATKPPRPRRA